MKNFILTVLILIVTTTFSFAEDDLYPLDFHVQVYPKEIHYGDVCFFTFSVTNKGPETLLLPYGKTFLHQMGGILYCGEKEIMPLSGFDRLEGTMPNASTFYTFPGRPVKPGETMEFHFRPVWIPLPEFADRGEAIELRKILEGKERDFLLRFYFDYHCARVSSSRPLFASNGQLLYADDV